MSTIFPIPIRGRRSFDVITFGTNAVDHLITVPEFPEFDSKIELVRVDKCPGGEAASTAVGLSRLGLATSYVGSFGTDREGEIGRRSLVDAGVDVSYSRVVDGAATQVGYILIDQTSGERTVIWKRDERLAFTSADIPDDLAERCRVLHLTPHDIEAAIKFARDAQSAGTTVSIDADRKVAGLEELISLVDVCILPESLVSELSDGASIDDALRLISARFGCRLVGATLGSRGSLILMNDRFIETTGYEVPGGCIDTTGAGDAFRTGLIFGLVSGRSVEIAAEYANATAALKCRMLGARDGLPNFTDLTLFSRKQ